MELFSRVTDRTANILPYDGIVNYYGKICTKELADSFLQKLLNDIEWKNDQAIIYGKLIVTKRKVAWYGNKPFAYTYSNITKQALPWNNDLLDLKAMIAQQTGHTFNSCLLNLYHTGEEGMAWHSDAEKDLQKDGAIASLSFGAERKFSFKHKQTAEKVEVFLEHGSLLVMKGTTQTHWLHRLPPTTKTKLPRVNLTFRTIVEEI